MNGGYNNQMREFVYSIVSGRKIYGEEFWKKAFVKQSGGGLFTKTSGKKGLDEDCTWSMGRGSECKSGFYCARSGTFTTKGKCRPEGTGLVSRAKASVKQSAKKVVGKGEFEFYLTSETKVEVLKVIPKQGEWTLKENKHKATELLDSHNKQTSDSAQLRDFPINVNSGAKTEAKSVIKLTTPINKLNSKDDKAKNYVCYIIPESDDKVNAVSILLVNICESLMHSHLFWVEKVCEGRTCDLPRDRVFKDTNNCSGYDGKQCYYPDLVTNAASSSHVFPKGKSINITDWKDRMSDKVHQEGSFVLVSLGEDSGSLSKIGDSISKSNSILRMKDELTPENIEQFAKDLLSSTDPLVTKKLCEMHQSPSA